MSVVLATVGVPPWTVTLPPLTRICPAASRLTTMVLSWASPTTDRTPVSGANDAVTDGRIRSLRCSRAGRKRLRQRSLRAGRDFPFSVRFNHDIAMKRTFRERNYEDGRPQRGDA